mgnify:CR=1 FL=1
MKPAYKPVLCVVSSHPIKGASGVPTGFFLAELTHPLKVLEDAGIKTTIASIRGGQPPVGDRRHADCPQPACRA